MPATGNEGRGLPTASNAMLPSILGIGFIQHFRLAVSVRENQVELEPLF